jgi:hypothetical protein
MSIFEPKMSTTASGTGRASARAHTAGAGRTDGDHERRGAHGVHVSPVVLVAVAGDVHGRRAGTASAGAGEARHDAHEERERDEPERAEADGGVARAGGALGGVRAVEREVVAHEVRDRPHLEHERRRAREEQDRDDRAVRAR